MRNFNENTITNAVLERISGASDPRIRQVSEALVRHLHAFVREVRRSLADGELAFHVCYGPARTTLIKLVRVAGARWTVE